MLRIGLQPAVLSLCVLLGSCAAKERAHAHGRPPNDADGGDTDIANDGDRAWSDAMSDDGPASDEGDPVGEGDDGVSDLAEVHFTGRFDWRDPDGPRCAWTYCSFSTRFRGTALELTLLDTSRLRYQVVVDGTPTHVFASESGRHTYHVASGLSRGEHDVEVVRASEALFGDTQFIEFQTVGDGELVPTARPTTRRLEVIGDSITAGYGNEGCPFGIATEDGFSSYATLAARAVSAEAHIVAQSGIGMYRDKTGNTFEQMPERYGLTLPADPTSIYDVSEWLPDAVVINLGTNDFAQGSPGPPFVDTYASFIRRLRGYYPNALILCVVHSGDSSYVSEIDDIIAVVADPRVEKLELSVPDWDGCDGHPSVAADRAMAASLVARLQLELGW